MKVGSAVASPLPSLLIRQQRFDLRMVQKLGHEVGQYLAALQPVTVLREHGRVLHQVVGRKSHEPAVQKIVVQLLHQLAFRPDAVEHLKQQRAQQLFRWNRGTAFARVELRQATVQLLSTSRTSSCGLFALERATEAEDDATR